jgi:uncharacterized SAM-binding protein YcdF (DUF218 family)
LQRRIAGKCQPRGKHLMAETVNKLRPGRAVYVLVLVILGLALMAGSRAAAWLVIDDPQKSDIIVVLAGETDYRPNLGLQLLAQHYAAKLVLDVPADQRIFGQTAPQLAQRWIQNLPERPDISICPIHGLSTKAESLEAGRCIEQLGGRRVLLVTSDFHTRRALSTFHRENPGLTFSVAASRNPQEFGSAWWRHREWAKTTWYEWTRLVWWKCVDQWGSAGIEPTASGNQQGD